MSDRLRVKEASGLLIFLNTQLKGWSRKNIKQRLKTGCVLVNDQQIMKHDHELEVGDNVEVRAAGKNTQQGVRRLEILYSDNDLVVINKPAGLLSVAAANENKQHALAILRKQLSHAKNSVALWPVHRLDRDTSGVLMFATSREMREAVNEGWSEAEKTYLAVVEGSPKSSKGRIDQPLRMDPEKYQMIVGPHSEAKNAVTHFKTLRTVKERTLVEVKLETGRQHQIRAHMAWLGHSVIGDPRYGTDGPRMGLHALSLSITRPKTGERLTFEAPAPVEFLDLLR
ncbi:RluA family pseudouridine synthase [Moritella viscosa]|uniref:Pseudouridine synthase n=1 Tax=Moritella viscosa TaxID=80854 RepID=A0A090IDS9_9GAMM|nr:RluA family pseudouridine synthase [Moritella viscosa]CED60450.1 pseudouridine synthase [Moritella viscosa]SGY97602.1 Pseudouridine synthase [Moritella viscosa]SGZ04233.1 Pseudouridine synthase [Moritella viscosa]SGZ04615.1 Pseudouridine synthase [Moritella viscosa]SGZ11077.1 Pseudouridine synthase [Moritella viscosa]